MTGHSDDKTDPVWDEALDWLLKIQADPDDARLRAALDGWRAASDAHDRAWMRAVRVWRLTGAVADIASRPEPPGRHQAATGEPAPAAVEPPPASVTALAPPRRRRRAVRVVAAATALAIAASLAVAVLPQAVLHLRADHVTGAGERREVVLEDGTVVILNAASAITVSYDESQRRVEVLQGDAFFTVAEDRSRRFAVTGDAMTVVDIGTAFGVGLDPAMLSVGVESGAVHVRYDGAVPAAAPRETRLDPGGRLRIDRATGRFTEDRLPPVQVAAWRDGLLVVENMPLGQVIDQIRRYYPGMIVVRDRALEDGRVTGVYDLRNPVSALRTALTPYGGKVTTITPYVLIVG